MGNTLGPKGRIGCITKFIILRAHASPVIASLIAMFFFTNIYISRAQVDTTYIYKTGTPFGTLDIRIAKSATQYYYLQEGKTMSYRESSPGVRTDSYLELLSWDSSPYTQGALREKATGVDNFIMNYRLLLPVNYQANYNPGYPMIIFLHGLGERGNCWDDKCYQGGRDWNYNTNTPPAPTNPDNLLLNNDLSLMNGGAVHLNARNLAGALLPNDPAMPARGFPGFVLVPQNMNGWTGTTVQDAIRLVRLLIKKYNIDENRIIIHGLSNGGAGTFEVIKRAPWLFSSALMMSPISDASVISQGLAPAIAHIPMWIFQGGKDEIAIPARTESTVKSLREAGAVVRFNLYPDLGHGTWNTAYKEPDFFSWMLANNKTQIHNYAGNNAICLTNSDGVKLELASGFFLYQWKKNGVLISGATSSTYLANTPGDYTARFSRFQNPTEQQWNPWSDAITITQQTPAQAIVEQQGTIILPDLNGNGDALLNSPGDYAHYYWNKNGTVVDFNGNQDDTLQFVTIKPTVGSGAYTLATAGYDNCPSPPSDPKNIFFNNEAPVVITAPSDFNGQVISSENVQLTWTDKSANELGFEIWRRKAISQSTYSPWQLRTLTKSNVVSFSDAGLEPLTTYQYKIRGVGNTGRSDYVPAAADQALVINTTVDNVRPSPPLNLKAQQTNINTITLSWESPPENTDIRQYHIYFNSMSVATDTTQLSLVLDALTVNTVYHFTVKAEDLGGNLSDDSNVANADTYVDGLYYQHSTGPWVSLDSIDWSLAEFKGKINNFSLVPRTQDDYFNFKFDGYLYIKIGGTYQFSTISNDGSRLMLDSVVIVNNDGIHDDVEIVSANQNLTVGPKRISVTFFEYAGAQSLTVKYKGPDTEGEWISIPDIALHSYFVSVNGVQPKITNETSLRVSVYPNPAQDNNIHVQAETNDNDPIHVNILDGIGKSIYERDFSAVELKEGINIVPNEKLSIGLYLINVSQNVRSAQFRFTMGN